MTAGKQLDVLGIGVAAVDDVLTVEGFRQTNAKLPVLGASRHGGGLTSTAMAAAATLGGKAGYAARFGEDELSAYMCGILRARGVDLSAMVPDREGRPYHSVIVVDRATGERTIFYDGRQFRQVLADDVADAAILLSRVVMLDFLTPPGPGALAEKVKRLGVPMVVDIEGCLEESAGLLGVVDHLIVPEEFARWRSGATALGEACAHLAQVKRTATVVTAGALGCWFAAAPDAAPVHVPAFEVEVVNTNGCGDTFHGAYALGVARGLEPMDAIVLATAAAALKASSRAGGGWDALPGATAVGELLGSRRRLNGSLRGLLESLERR